MFMFKLFIKFIIGILITILAMPLIDAALPFLNALKVLPSHWFL